MARASALDRPAPFVTTSGTPNAIGVASAHLAATATVPQVTGFNRLSESELDRLGDEALVDYVVAAREAGDDEAAKSGVSVLAFGFWDRVRSKVALKVPPGDVDDVAMDVMESAAKSTFSGKVIGQFGSWINTITTRRIADFHRDREGEQTSLLGEEHEGDEDRWGEDSSTESETVSVEYGDAAGRVLAGRSPLHQRVVKLYGPNLLGFLDLSAAQVCAEIAGNPGETMTEANVHQIWRRFKKDLAVELGEDSGDG